MATRGIPFVWHFKEGLFICLEKGTWPLLINLHEHSDGQIFASPEMRDWVRHGRSRLVVDQTHSCAGWGHLFQQTIKAGRG